MRVGARIAAVALALLGVLALAPLASAVVVRLPSGQLAGVMPQGGIDPASIPGVVRSAVPNVPLASNGNLDYNGGPVLHTVKPFLIFWDPSSGISAKSRSVLGQYLTDVATAGPDTNVYGVARQYTDASGFAAGSQTFNAATQAIPDTHAYPAKAAPCTTANCVTDAQIQTELKSLIAARSLPTGTGANAPIYFVVTPVTENVCGTGLGCANANFCAYHSFFTTGGHTVIYSSIPFLPVGTSGKGCQTDNPANTVFQSPNGDRADNAADDMSHESSEAITDPLLNAWFNANTGLENGDQCESWGPRVSPSTGQNPNDYLPVLGGSEPAGTLFDQLINGHRYYTQTEWSNGDLAAGGCEAQPVTATLTPDFTTTSPATPGSQVTFTPTSASSVTWSFGDGTPAQFNVGSPVAHHSYSAAGTYTVALTLVDTHGNVSTVSHNVMIALPPAASFTDSGSARAGSLISFDASGSSDPNPGGSITSYSWNFGDSSAAASGASATHAFALVGTYTVTLTVTANTGRTATVSQTVSAMPTAALAVTTARPTSGQPVVFSAAGSLDPGGSISSYAWSFGDGSGGSGATPAHTYAHPGTYSVSLTITDQSGLQSSASGSVTVASPPPVRRTKITKVVVRGKQLSITVSGAGTLKLGTKHVTVRRAGTVRVTIPLSAAQKRRLKHEHKLTLTLKLTFVSSSGKVQHISERVTVHG